MPDYQLQPTGNLQLTNKIILLVEDDAAISELLVQLITEETPHKVYTVADGLQALDLVKSIKPDLFILDYWLPSIHGIELYDRLHSNPRLEGIPAIMLSVNAPQAEIKKRHIMYMKKPFDVGKLLEAIQGFLD